MSNKFLGKILGAAGNSAPASLTSKIGLGVSATGLGVSAANFHNNSKSSVLEQQRIRLEKERNKLEEERAKTEAKSLNALKSIHKVLATPVKS